MKKRIISSIMCLAMLLSLLPVTAFAVEGEGETLESATGIDVTEAGAFTSGNNLMT